MPSQSKDDHSLHSQQQRVGYQYSKETPRKIFTILHFRVPLLQSSKPDTTFQFGQVMDVHMFAISPLSLFANNDYFPNGYSPVYNTTWMRLSPPYWLLMITSPMDVHLFCNTTWISAGAGPDFWLRSQLLQSNGIAIFQRVTNQDQYTSTNNDRIFTFESMDVSWFLLRFVIV